jgi:hypothetical protein
MALQPLFSLGRSFSFLILHSQQDSLDEVSSRRKASTYTQNNTNTEKIHTDIHASIEIRTYNPTVRASEDSSCLRPLGYRDGLASERAKTVHALDRSATVTG